MANDVFWHRDLNVIAVSTTALPVSISLEQLRVKGNLFKAGER